LVRSTSGCIAAWLAGVFINVNLPHIKEKRESQWYANNKTGDDGQPQPPHTEASTLGNNENPEYQWWNDDIQAEEASNAIGKQLMKEKRKIEAVLQKPRSELPVRQKYADKA
jgi:hypothetical protein